MSTITTTKIAISTVPRKLLRFLSSPSQGPAEDCPNHSAKGYADINPDAGAKGYAYAPQNPTEHGPYTSAYPYAPGLSIHVPIFLGIDVWRLCSVRESGPEPR